MNGSRSPLSVWGGVECTLNRVGERFFDQLELSGHASRESDLDEFAGLGLRTLRYPILWERTMKDGVSPDWSWSDARLRRLKELAIEPIVGLVHHGSGPRTTSLLDPAFPEKLAAYARRVVERYPWVRSFTPVNEPLMTARISALQGHWYPHERSDRAFVRAHIAQIKGIALAMRTIRSLRHDARLVQTEDLGVCRSTEDLAYQAEFENHRRFLSFDLLSGRVTPGHELYEYLLSNGASERELAWFVENPCPPDIVGINYNVTSERFLDGRVHLYPKELVRANRREHYADVEAVRVCRDGLLGPTKILVDAWERYRLPVALTEAHLSCTADEQIAWLYYLWQGALAARARGAEVRAVTAWALVGTYGWQNLVTKEPMTYEPGAFSVEKGRFRKTDLGSAVAALCRGSVIAELDGHTIGWWRAPGRLAYEEPVTEHYVPRELAVELDVDSAKL